jgi:hypothetical protein
MPDVSMCTGGSCPLRADCYRHTAKPSPYMQTYFLNPPVNADGTCGHFWKVKR